MDISSRDHAPTTCAATPKGAATQRRKPSIFRSFVFWGALLELGLATVSSIHGFNSLGGLMAVLGGWMLVSAYEETRRKTAEYERPPAVQWADIKAAVQANIDLVRRDRAALDYALDLAWLSAVRSSAPMERGR